ncbi:uncharacterized protein [Aristolochia californica]|uniref:uncharacterized protein n=1 Tax=Aristolochia californica TaxID=171875 RepID=UPI0035D7A7BF
MAADVSSLVRILNGYKEEESSGAGKKGLITRDLLGGCSIVGSKELDLDLQVPNGWEKRLDMKSGKIYLHRSNSPTSTAPNERNPQPQVQDLNFPPSSSSGFLDDDLDLKLVPTGKYQSVCTLEKVKSALKRAERGSNSGKKRSFYLDGSSSSPASSSGEAKSVNSFESEKESDTAEKMFAAACPGCLLYVLISEGNPRCPRCDTVVPSPSMKKPRIDLNCSAL